MFPGMTAYLHGKYLSGIKMFQQESHIISSRNAINKL